MVDRQGDENDRLWNDAATGRRDDRLITAARGCAAAIAVLIGLPGAGLVVQQPLKHEVLADGVVGMVQEIREEIANLRVIAVGHVERFI